MEICFYLRNSFSINDQCGEQQHTLQWTHFFCCERNEKKITKDGYHFVKQNDAALVDRSKNVLNLKVVRTIYMNEIQYI